MKFMMNGAVTCGTMDGANIEIFERAGRENNYVFGAEADELDRLRKEGYDPAEYLAKDADARRALEMLQTFPDEKGYYKELYDSLTVGASWHKPDHYFISDQRRCQKCADVREKADAERRLVGIFLVRPHRARLRRGHLGADR